jgi:hypothetical protein
MFQNLDYKTDGMFFDDLLIHLVHFKIDDETENLVVQRILKIKIDEL